MTTTTRREWNEVGQDAMAETTGRCLFVADGYIGHYCTLADGETVEAALEDYASGYKVDEPTEICASWALYEDGEEVGMGTHTFAAGWPTAPTDPGDPNAPPWVVVQYSDADGKSRRYAEDTPFATEQAAEYYLADLRIGGDDGQYEVVQLRADEDGYYLPAAVPTHEEVRRDCWNTARRVVNHLQG